MPKTPSQKVYNLIQSLSGSEKRYFKLFASKSKSYKESKYMLLFDAIDEQTVYDDEKLKEIVYANEVIQSRKYSELKAYLYDLILKSLQNYDEKSSIDYRLKGLLQSVRVLHKRSHYEDAKDILAKAKKLAYRYEAYTSLLEMVNWEKQIAYAQADIAFLDKYLVDMEEEEKQALGQLANQSNYRNILLRILISIRKNAVLRSEEQVRILNAVIDHPLLEDISEATSYKARVLYHRIYGLYYYSLAQYEQFYLSSENLLKLMEASPHFLDEDVSDYINALSNLTLSCGLLKRYGELEESLDKFRNIKPKTLEDELTIHRQYYLLKFRFCIVAGEFGAGQTALEQHLKELERFDKRLFERGSFYFQYFYIYFGIGDYDQALNFLNQWLNLPRSIERQDLQSLARILNLIIHYEMGNTFLLEYLLRSTYRFLRKRNRMYEFERQILRFIKDSNKIRTQKELREAFIRLKADFEQLAEIPSERALLTYFNFIDWLESKITGKSFAEVVRGRYQEQSS